MGAYEILDALNAAGAEGGPGESKAGRGLAPIAVYRALEFLIEQGFAHKLTSRNAFTACPHMHAPHELVAFLICDACGGVDELSTKPLAEAIGANAGARALRAPPAGAGDRGHLRALPGRVIPHRRSLKNPRSSSAAATSPMPEYTSGAWWQVGWA